jgi:hypothetical protein
LFLSAQGCHKVLVVGLESNDSLHAGAKLHKVSTYYNIFGLLRPQFMSKAKMRRKAIRVRKIRIFNAGESPKLKEYDGFVLSPDVLA